tara:strand:- start:21 stop:239 length:219 start_codon:yes stop_codon:yes gene_type:complete
MSNNQMEDEEYLTKCVVDPVRRTFYLYSSEGDTKQVDCDNVEEFMNVLELVRATCPDDRLVYTDPLSGKNEV